MKCFWRVLFVGLSYLAYAGQARCEDLAQANPAQDQESPWQPEEPATPDHQDAFDFRLVNAHADEAIGPTQAPIQVGKVDLNACDESCSPVWAHRSGVFGEILLLRARGAEVAYAVPIDGAIVPPPVPPIQVGPLAVADPDYSAGFRVGGQIALDDCTSVGLSYTRFQSSSQDTVATTAPLVLRSLVLHPGTANAGADFLSAAANLDVKFDLIDADYRAVWAAGDLWVVNYLVGARYANLKQDFTGVYTGTGTTDALITNSNFDGGGIRIGADGMRFAACSGFLIYGKTSASFLAGQYRARYTQFSDVDPLIVDTSWSAGRLVTILDLELGGGWQSECGRWRISGGYMVAGWFNTIPQNQWINAVQTNNFSNLSNTINPITFDGFTARLDYRW